MIGAPRRRRATPHAPSMTRALGAPISVELIIDVGLASALRRKILLTDDIEIYIREAPVFGAPA